MTVRGRSVVVLLLLGDLVFLTVSLWLTLLIRSGAWPVGVLFGQHLRLFAWLFAGSIVVFFISDLYRLRTLVFDSALASRVFRAQLASSLLAVLVFYFVPHFNQIGLTPKTNLFIYLIVSSILIFLWRRFLAQFVYRRRPALVAFACRGAEAEELSQAVVAAGQYRLAAPGERPALLVLNRYAEQTEEELAALYKLFFRGVEFVAIQDLYGEVFGRVPLGLVSERWFLEQISNRPNLWYDLLKRAMDVVIALILGVVSLAVYPIIVLAIKLDDRGPIFFYDERVGRHGRIICLPKFRTMSTEAELAKRRVTRVGRWLRRSRLDELPQLWSVVRGDQSLIGPRPERVDYVELYRTRIPFYDARHLIAPGLSGWAQMYHDNHPHFTLAEDETREKLAYDLYYIKHRSLWLDLAIALKTIKVLISRRGI